MLSLNISVSKLERFDDFLAEKWGLDQQKFIDYLEGRDQKTFEKDFGTAVHKFLENPFDEYAQAYGGITVEAEFLSNDVLKVLTDFHQTLPTPNATEVWVNKEIEVNGIICNVRGKVDCLCPGIIHDFKTTRTKPSYEAYMDKTQHLWYMFMADVPMFCYDVFFIQEKKELSATITHEEFPFEWDAAYETKLIHSLKGFVDFIKVHGMIDDWNEIVKSGTPVRKILKPEILCHPHIPKPLHGVAPREIMGDDWWNSERQLVYASTDYHCAACGIHKSQAKKHEWLEAHEFWKIDYRTGICEILSIEPLCHYCHNFIHSGRLKMILGNDKSEKEVIDILEHGFKILAANNLKCFPFTLQFATSLGANTFGVDAYDLPSDDVDWNDWKLIWNGKEYHSKFKSQEEWSNFYSSKVESDD